MKKIILILSIFISSIFASNVSTYLTSNIQDNNSIKTSLKKVGFDIVGEYDAMGNSNYHVIAFTHAKLKNISSKENRGFASVLKVLINKKDSKLVFTNPLYYLKAMLQDDYDSLAARQMTNKLKSIFKLTNGKYSLDEDDLSGYHFMFAMPYYKDMLEVGSGENLNDKLLKNAKDNIVFKINLANSTLYGIKMNVKNGEKDYMGTLKQEQSAAFLPYTVLIQGNKAKILHPKYYLALSLPKLTMGEFMNIMDTPTHIEDYFKSLFN